MAKIIDGKRIAAETRARIRKDTEHFIARTGITPGLAVIIVGDNPASQVYVRNKKRACEEAGMNSWVFEMPESTSMSELLSQIELLKNDSAVHGILVQLPLPRHLDGFPYSKCRTPHDRELRFSSVYSGGRYEAS